ncbi:uracil-DNA glycosylase [Candidatus Woesearchaeota archaeon]|jgi:uracil-DNA glycosylase|nr:uracil-DNA glycosylase [Candidatus Woesearchaeota archaeon]MBT6044557.1 uracil-DNA glycosylase [Candidatus Woesearchaeota archaeon]
MELNVLKDEYSTCSKCPELVDYRSQVVFGSKHMNKCPVMIIGEAPGKVEDENGEPFVGRSGQILNKFLEEIGLTRDKVFITNTILCRPPENRNPKSDELLHCRERLDKTIEILNPKVIITLGNFATKYLLETKEGITKVRGKVYEKNGRNIVPMAHPAVVLYNGSSEAIMTQFRADFSVVKGLLGN